VTFSTEPGRNVEILCGERRAQARANEKTREFELEIDLRGLREPLLDITAAPLFVSEEQRRHGDTRGLGAFVRRIAVRSAHGERELDLREATPPPARSFTLTRDRFRLPFNRGIVRGADAFIVHSEFVREKIRAERKSPAPVAVVPHGAKPRWGDEAREVARARLGLPDDWRAGILLTSFGNVQAHKRIEPLLAAFAAARAAREDLRLALIGTEERESLDAPAIVRRLGLESSVRLTGRVHESEAWPWIHAGDFAVQLRGPSSGGTSGGVFQSLGLGRGVIASDVDEQRELPPNCVLRVAPGPNEVGDLTRLILELAGDPARRAELERGARTFVETECSWSRVARLYAENLANFRPARGSGRNQRRQVGR
jgi:glycosyltransferase involved in cell wall biosynthesis